MSDDQDKNNPFTAAVEQKMAESRQHDELATRRKERLDRRRREEQSEKVKRLYAGLDKVEKVREVELPIMSKALGQPYRVQVRDVEPRELIASSLFPPTSATIMEEMIRQSEAVTAQARNAVGMESLIREIAEDAFANPETAIIVAMHEIEDVMACLTVNDPDINLVMHEHEAVGNKVWIRRLRREDISAIANAAWHNVEVDAAEALPFPVPVHADGAVVAGEGDGAAAEPDRVAGDRSDEV